MLMKQKSMASREIKGGTKIIITIGSNKMPATLNNCKSSRELISRLPYTMNVHRHSHDFYGVMQHSLSYDPSEVHNGWLNGDIDFATNGNYFTIFFDDEENSKQFSYQVDIGKVDCKLSVIRNLKGNDYKILIESAK